MRHATPCTLALALTAVVSSAQGPANSVQQLEGGWVIVAAEAAGTQLKPGDTCPDGAVVRHGKLTLFHQGKPVPRFQGADLRAVADNPAAVDLVWKEAVLPCLCRVDGEVMKFALPLARENGGPLPRPQSFDTRNRPAMVFTARRAQ